MEERIYFKDSKNYFTYYSLTDKLLPLVVIVPGGGYHHTSLREAMNVANYFMPLGFHAVILNYREQIDLYPTPQEELAYVIDYFRLNSKKYNVLENKILNIGFSAGAHLVLSQAIYHNEYGNNSLSDGLVLCYPVVSSDKDYGHISSFDGLINGIPNLNARPTKEEINERFNNLKINNPQRYNLLDKLSLEKHVTKELPDVFMWHTYTDESVNFLNSLKLLEQFKLNNINCEYHLFPKGAHGMSLADDSMTTGGNYLKDDYIHEWTNYLKNWI